MLLISQNWFESVQNNVTIEEVIIIIAKDLAWKQLSKFDMVVFELGYHKLINRFVGK